ARYSGRVRVLPPISGTQASGGRAAIAVRAGAVQRAQGAASAAFSVQYAERDHGAGALGEGTPGGGDAGALERSSPLGSGRGGGVGGAVAARARIAPALPGDRGGALSRPVARGDLDRSGGFGGRGASPWTAADRGECSPPWDRTPLGGGPDRDPSDAGRG